MPQPTEQRIIGERRIDPLGGGDRCQREMVAGQVLAGRHHVRDDGVVLKGEHPPRAPESGHDLISDQQHALLIADLPHRSQVAVRQRDDTADAQDRLDHDGGHLPGAEPADGAGDLLRSRHRAPLMSGAVGAGAAPGRANRHESLWQRPGPGPAERGAGGGERAQRRTVVAVMQSDHRPASRLAAQAVIDAGDPDRGLGGLRPGVDEERPGQRAGHEPGDPAGEQDRRRR